MVKTDIFLQLLLIISDMFLNFAFTFSKMEFSQQNQLLTLSNSAVTLQLWPSKFLVSSIVYAHENLLNIHSACNCHFFVM